MVIGYCAAPAWTGGEAIAWCTSTAVIKAGRARRKEDCRYAEYVGKASHRAQVRSQAEHAKMWYLVASTVSHVYVASSGCSALNCYCCSMKQTSKLVPTLNLPVTGVLRLRRN